MYWILLTAIGLAVSALTVRALVRWQGDRYLCDDCRFNQPEACFKPERPEALVCLAYKPEEKA